MRIILLYILLISRYKDVFSQDIISAIERNTEPINYRAVSLDLYTHKRYFEAIPYLESTLAEQSFNDTIRYYLANCYRLTRQYAKAELHYSFLSQQKKLVAPDIFYWYAMMQKANENYFDAQQSFNNSRFDKALPKEMMNEAQKQMDDCMSANVRKEEATIFLVEPAGNIINRLYSNYAAIIQNDSLYLTGTHVINKNLTVYMPNTKGKYSYQLLDRIHVASKTASGNWKKREAIFGFQSNEQYNYLSPSLSPDGRTMIFTFCKQDSAAHCDIAMSRKTPKGWGEPIVLKGAINDSIYSTKDAQLLFEKDQMILVFSAIRKNGMGAYDLYYCYPDANMKCSEIKMIRELSSSQNDISPWYDEQQNKLYFSTTAHQSFGGYDIFSAEGFFEKGFGLISYLPYPINCGADDYYYRNILEGSSVGLFSSNRMNTKTMNRSTCCDNIYFVNPIIKPSETQLIVEGRVANDHGDSAVQARITLIDPFSNRAIDSGFTNDNGYFRIVTNKKETYILNISAVGNMYYSGEVSSIRENSKEISISETFVLQSIEVGVNVILKQIYFETNSSELKEVSNFELDRLVRFLNENRRVRIEISGHTDNTGQTDYNMKLSTERAKGVCDYLIVHGINETRLNPKGFGSDKPIADNNTREGQKANRRVEFKIVHK